MSKLLLASNNRGKLLELRPLLEPIGLQVISPRELDLELDVVEDADTFEGNARKKATAFARAAGMPALADDSGLEVDALDGAPGVYSARFSGDHATEASNNALLLERLADVPPPRTGRFRCVLALADAQGNVLITTDGTVEGVIVETPRGTHGFGYDPLFVPEGFEKTMAELSGEAKSAISHRGKAFRALRDILGA